TAETHGVGAGVLIRAIEPLEGIALMIRNRGVSRLTDVARGPGRLTAALGIDKRFDGIDLCDPTSPSGWVRAWELCRELALACASEYRARRIANCDFMNEAAHL